MSNLLQAEKAYLTPPERDAEVIGYCINCFNKSKFTILTSDYEAYIDDEKNLFCSEECAMEYHGIRGFWD